MAIAAGNSHSCAVIGDGKAKCWGYQGGQLGHGCNYNWKNSHITINTVNSYSKYNLPIDLGSGHNAKTIATGRHHTCAILDNDKVKCWGFEHLIGSGRDGDIIGDDPAEMGDDLPVVDLGTNYTVKSIAVGPGHTCAILGDGKVKCWGGGGLLGLGHAESIGNDPNEMGDNLPAVDLGTDRTAKSITVGSGHTCAILDNDTVKCWGDGEVGQLGQGKIPTPRDNLVNYPIFNTSPPPSYEYIGDEEGEMGENLPAIDLGAGRTAKAVSAGSRHTCAILDNDTVKCWGLNSYGSLGWDGYIVGGKPEDMGDNLPVIDLGTGRTAKAISLGSQFTCVITSDNAVRCWGRGDEGQLGQGHADHWGEVASEMGDNLPSVDLGTGRTAKAISAGDDHACVLLDNDAMKCWGSGYSGELGQEGIPTRSRVTRKVAIGDEAGEMGDNLPPIAL